MAREPLRIVIAGGGTGGHLYPGIAVAREILRRETDAHVTFAGTTHGIEARVVPKEGFDLDIVRSRGLKGKSIVDRARGAALIPVGLLDALRIVGRRRPHLVIGVGGFSSGPVVLAAWLRGVPTMILEQNAMPGLTNRLLARFVRAAALTFEASAPFFRAKGFVAGNPVRPEFATIGNASDHGRSSEHGARVLVFGGSQGAHAINMAMVEAAPRLATGRPGLRVTHQTGERDVAVVREAYRAAGLESEVEPFFFDMARRMGEADVIVCRAGATTIAEITAAAKPAILIPLPTATDDHQRKNAEALAAAGAADVLLQQDMTGDALGTRITALTSDAGRRARLSTGARAFARPDAARVIVDRVMTLVAPATAGARA